METTHLHQNSQNEVRRGDSSLGLEFKTGQKHYRAFIGPPEKYDLVAAMQFNLLTLLGLREHHYLLDIGCGSLRAGKLFLPYLLPERYYGIEPEAWLIEDGIRNEIGNDIIALKKPVFSNDNDFNLSQFGRKFDYIIAQSIFSHASQKQIDKCFAEARKALTQEGIFVFTFKRGTESYSGDEWVYPGCIQYTPECITRLAGNHGLQFQLLDWKHPNFQTWAAVSHF